jgi:hypothetical protein
MDRLEHPLDPGEGTTDEFHGLINRYALHRVNAELAWIEEAVASLEGPAQPPASDPYGVFSGAPARRAEAFRRDEE